MPEPAPYHAALAEGPEPALAHWLTTADGLRIRLGFWPGGDWPGGDMGTVVIFPGRTEFIEKYGRTATRFRDRGFAVAAIDWRGQGLAARMLADPDIGHVGGAFTDYQNDVDAVLAALGALGAPRPYFLVGHSMGGAIGLRSLLSGKDFVAAAFSAPMWGIAMSRIIGPFAKTLARGLDTVGFSTRYAPGAQRESYIRSAPFKDNTLTTDPDAFAYMKRQAEADRLFALGGPSVRWLHSALVEIEHLNRAPLPDLPAVTAVGTLEAIADRTQITALARRWDSCAFHEYEGAQHELMMERPEVRDHFIDMASTLFREAA